MPQINFTAKTRHFFSNMTATPILPNSPLSPSPSLLATNSPTMQTPTITGGEEQQNSCGESTPTNGLKAQQKNPKLYKTELCRSWMETGRCNYGERCQYAHGEREKRPVTRHPKYKTEQCQSYHKTGYCPYGPRCHFIHNENAAQLKALITANEQALRMVHELAALGIEQQLQQQPETPKRWSMFGHPHSPLANAPQSQFNLNQGQQIPTHLNNNKNLITSSSPFLNAIGTTSETAAFHSTTMQKNLQNAIGEYAHYPHNSQHYFLGKAQSNGSQEERHLFPEIDSIHCGQPDFINNGGNIIKDARDYDGMILNSRNGGQTVQTKLSTNYWSPTTKSPSSAINYHQKRPKTLDIFLGANSASNRNCSPSIGTSPLVIDQSWTFPSGIEEMDESKFIKKDHSPTLILPMQFTFLNDDDKFCDASTVQHIQKNPIERSDLDLLDESVPQILLGNLSAIDEEYSRSSIISSNIDSGNESPMALFEEDVRKSVALHESQQTTPLPTAPNENEEIVHDVLNDQSTMQQPQHRRSSTEGNGSKKMVIATTIIDDVMNGVENSSGSNMTTASSSLISLISSVSSTTPSSTRHQIALSERNNESQQILQPFPVPCSIGKQQKNRLPVFEGFSLN